MTRTKSLDMARILAAVTEVTGHAPGTFEHESALGRVLGELATKNIAVLRTQDRAPGQTVVITREAYSK